MDEPLRLPCLLETVPEPTMEPASTSRVLVMWATSWGKLKTMSLPASGQPKSWPLRCTVRGRALAVAPGVAEFVGGHGHRRRRKPAWTGKMKPLGQFGRNEVAQETSLTSMRSRMAGALGRRGAHGEVAGDDGDLGLEVDAPILGQGIDRVAGADEGSPNRPGTSADRSRIPAAVRRRGRGAPVRRELT